MPEAYVPTWGEPEPAWSPPASVSQVVAVRLDPRDLLLIFGVMMAANILSLMIVAAVLSVGRRS